MASTTVIRDVAPGVTIFLVPFIRSNLLKIGGAMTIVKLTSGALAVVSPIALNDEVTDKVASIGGEVKYIISPNTEHHFNITAWSKQYPGVHVVVAEGLAEKREANPETKGTTYATVFTAANKTTTRIGPDFDVDFDYEYIDGSKARELVLLHKPTGTLIEGDLIFNLPAKEAFSKSGIDATAGIATKLMGAVLQTASPGWHKRVLWHVAASDKASFAQSMKRISTWEFDRIIPCHGDIIETGGKTVFSTITEPYLKA